MQRSSDSKRVKEKPVLHEQRQRRIWHAWNAPLHVSRKELFMELHLGKVFLSSFLARSREMLEKTVLIA